MRSEVVIGFVGPVGVASKRFQDITTSRLKAFGYECHLVRASEEIDHLKSDGYLKTQLATTPEFERIRTHMEAGDELRRLADPGLLAYAVATAIGKQRPVQEDNPNQTLPMSGHAWLVSSLKNPAEVAVLRSVYREGFFLIGLYASEKARRESLMVSGMTETEAATLIAMDLEGDDKSGQQTRKTFELADAWVENDTQLVRVLDLIFGDSFQTPDDDENAMSHAYTEALRSSDLSRQVGAIIVANTGEMIATGRNEVAAPEGGQYSPPTPAKPTARDCDLGEDFNQKERLAIQGELVAGVQSLLNERFAEDPLDEAAVVAIKEIVTEVLATSRLHDITEYGRAVHAEMAALTAASRVGSSVRGATLYCTTFPCHNCAKHIVASGIKRVVFVEPYPKSKTKDLHADTIEVVGEEIPQTKMSEATRNSQVLRTRFEPFLGVGPRRYFDLFSMNLGDGRAIRRKDETGKKVSFLIQGATPRVPLAAMNYLAREIDSAAKLDEALETLKENSP